MGVFLQQILLSDVFLFLIMGVMILLITSWAHAIREYAGYTLGWLLGILLIIMMSAFTLETEVVIDTADIAFIQGPFTLMMLFISAMLGLGIGFAALSVIRSNSANESRIKRALAVAIITSFTLSAGYLMLISVHSTRLIIAVFSLALAIGGLFNYIFSFSRRSRAMISTPADDFTDTEITIQSEPGLEVRDVPANNLDLPSPLAQRIHNLQQRVRYRNGQSLDR